jgi:hypothetical protein
LKPTLLDSSSKKTSRKLIEVIIYKDDGGSGWMKWEAIAALAESSVEAPTSASLAAACVT